MPSTALSLSRYDSDDGLKRLFTQLNHKWFDGRLKADTIVVWRKRLNAMAMYTDGTPDKIEMSCALASLPRVIEWVLLHEMAHASVGWGERQHHGPKWRREIARLVRIGAYEGLF
jgi:hypothetical protein